MYLFVESQEPQVHRLRAASLTFHNEERGDDEVADLADVLLNIGFCALTLFLNDVWTCPCDLCFDI